MATVGIGRQPNTELGAGAVNREQITENFGDFGDDLRLSATRRNAYCEERPSNRYTSWNNDDNYYHYSMKMSE
ncbi:unnamed protein product [Anisakis simplex]|uniref:Uncharacterized protein n=1 Tax=Anisakis simplex TaxID=6269 RepID=A0A0M3JCK1_ANISI|nr:unnamed protein product [Anisakis simplex]